jgi:hypothetical protein
VNEQEAHAIRDRIRLEPREIRVLCPRGHFIVHLALHANGPGDGVLMHPRGGPDKSYVGNVHEGNHGFRMDIDSVPRTFRVKLHCTRTKCKYLGAFNFDVLAVLLAKVALDGHAEYRLTQ